MIPIPTSVGNSATRAIVVAERFTVTYFADEFAKSLRTQQVTLPELRGLILRTTAHKKIFLPWLKCATFGTKRTKLGSLRHNDNVTAISGLELDYDDEEVSIELGATLLRRARLKSLLYTSPSHTDAKPRWRVLLPTSCDRPPQERKRLVARVDHACCGIFAPESFTLSQSFYFGSVKSNPAHRVIIISGDYIDQRDDLAAGIESTAAPRPNPERTCEEGRLMRALAFVPNDDWDWKYWCDVGLAIYGATNGSDAGFAMFDAWSRRSAKYDFAFTRKTWIGFRRSPPSRIGAGTIFFLASRFAPKWADQLDDFEPDARAVVQDFLEAME
jgi:hypothetical protein